MRVKTSLLYLHATAIMLARAVLFPYSLLYLQTTIGRPGCLKVINCAVLMLHYNTIVQCRSGYRRLTRLLNCAALMLICVYIVQCRSGYVVSLTTPTKAEPLYKVHTHARPCSQFYDRDCPHFNRGHSRVLLSFSFYS